MLIPFYRGAFILGEVFGRGFGGISSRRRSTGVLNRVGHGDDFEDEVFFKRGRVVTPRFPEY